MEIQQLNRTRTNFKAIFIIGVLFFIFGFISWINSILIPYFKLICQLSDRQSMLVAFAFYISYFIMAFPSSVILKKTGLKNGMAVGLLIMSLGTLIFIPAALSRTYSLFLVGLFMQATGLTLLQTAANPYIVVLGPIESAAKRISIMGICNKIAGAIAPLLLIHFITKNPDEIDSLKHLLPGLTPLKQQLLLDGLSGRLIGPYILITSVLVILGLIIRKLHLPEVADGSDDSVPDGCSHTKTNIFQYPHVILGALTVFAAVSAEVLVVDSIINYAQFMDFSFKSAKFFATYTLVFMIFSYLLGILTIPKFISQKRVLLVSSVTGLVLSSCAMLISGKSSVWCITILGLSNAMLWPSIWPLALDGLGRLAKQGSALMIMGVVGGAVTPLVYGFLSDHYNPQLAYIVLIPCYLFILFFALKGHMIGKSNRDLKLLPIEKQSKKIS